MGSATWDARLDEAALAQIYDTEPVRSFMIGKLKCSGGDAT